MRSLVLDILSLNHTSTNIRQAVGDEGLDREGKSRSREVELGISRI